MLPVAELERLTVQPYTCFHKVRQALHVTLHPRYLNSLELGLLDYFNKQINRWHPKLNGILANYGKLQLKTPHGMLLNEEAHIHLDVVSDFWVFRPEIGAILQGTVTKMSQKHVACLVHGVFNVPCYHPNNLGSAPWWGINAQIGKSVRFRVIKMDVSQKIPFILGELEKWGLDGNPVSDNTSLTVQPIEEIGPERWEQVTGGNESQGEHSDADSGIHSLPKRSRIDSNAGKGHSSFDLPKPTNLGNQVAVHLSQLKPLGQDDISSAPKHQGSPTKRTPAKKTKGSKQGTKQSEPSNVSTLGISNPIIKDPLKPPNIDDLIKSIQAPPMPIAFPSAPIIPQQLDPVNAKTSPKKKQSAGDVIKRQCHFCDHIAPKKGLKNHIISAHFKEQLLAKIPSCAPGKSGPYQCPKCEKSNKDRTDILRHFANTHNEILEFCSEVQLLGREVSENDDSAMTIAVSGKTNTNLSAAISNRSGGVSKGKINDMSGKNIQIQTENSAPKKKKKHKKEKTEALGSWDLGGASTSNLSNTSATPIRNPVFSKVSENDTGMSVEGSSKKKKKKNKEKDKEKEMANLRAIKRESADKTNVTTQSSPSKKSKYDDDESFNASSYYVDTTTIEHKKSKKKKKNKKKDD